MVISTADSMEFHGLNGFHKKLILAKLMQKFHLVNCWRDVTIVIGVYKPTRIAERSHLVKATPSLCRFVHFYWLA